MTYPPPLSDEQRERLISNIEDWQLCNGSLLKVIHDSPEQTVLAYPIGVTLFPTPFPRHLFEQALALQETYNMLYAGVAEDREWIHGALKGMLEVDELVSMLWGIHEEVEQQGYVQDLTLGVFRSDYMLHVPQEGPRREIQLKQVELNTVSCAGGVHGERASRMHQYLHQTRVYTPNPSVGSSLTLTSSAFPPNNTTKLMSSGLAAAYSAYGPPKSGKATQTCILMLVQPHNHNIADERPIEYALWNQKIPIFRVLFSQETLDRTSLTPTRELLYHLPNEQVMEVSVVYFRAGLHVQEFNGAGRECRLRMEISMAIKCPSVLSHLTGFKKIQQELMVPGTLERFLSKEEAKRIRDTFHPMYPLDESPAGITARKQAMDAKTAEEYILKPSLEGGGHNVYGDDIPEYLAELPLEKWPTYVLMEKIKPPLLHNTLSSERGVYEGPVISELGVFGYCLWRRWEGKGTMVQDIEPSWSFKTKNAEVDEMSVVKGYGCFDSPALLDREVFASCCGEVEEPDQV